MEFKGIYYDPQVLWIFVVLIGVLILSLASLRWESKRVNNTEFEKDLEKKRLKALL